MSDLNTLATSYLDHVLIALRANDRAARLRDFLDPWWVFERGDQFVYRRKDGGFTPHTFNNPCPWSHRERLPHFDWISPKAEAIVGLGRAARIVSRKTHPEHLRLVVDHSVPLAVLAAELWKEPLSWERENLRAFLRQNLKRAVISFAEDAQLNAAGLRNSMPARWRLGDDPFARYSKALIEP